MTVYIEKLDKINEKEIEKSVARCLKKICDLEFLRDVKTVLIKPNFINSTPAKTGVTTDLRIIKSLIKIFKLFKKEVIVGESSLHDTEKVFKDLGIYKLEKLGAKVINFENDKKVLVKSPVQLTLKEFYLPQSVLDADLIISVPKMKTHSDCMVTLSIKNFLGCVPKKDRNIAHIKNINESIIDVFSYLKKNKKLLCFVDAIVALEGKLGPINGNSLDLGLIIAGNDLLATDITCVRIMDYLPSKVKHIEIATDLGLGKIDDVIIGKSIDELKRKFEMPPEIVSKISFLKPITKRIFKKRPFLAYPDKCILCKKCIEMCPKEAISIRENKITFDYNKCIGCLVCCESCMQGALDYKISNSALYKITRKIKKKIIG